MAESATYSVPPGATTVDVAGLDGFTAVCPVGYLVVGTGWEGDFGDMWSVDTYDYFVGGFGTNDASIAGDFRLQAICAKTSQPTTLSSSGNTESRASAMRDYKADVRADLKAWSNSGE